MFYSGAATWTPGQLEDEISGGSWFIVEGNGNHIFNQQPIHKALTNNTGDETEGEWRGLTLKDADVQKLPGEEDETLTAVAQPSTSTSSSDSVSVQQSVLPHAFDCHRSSFIFPYQSLWNCAMYSLGGEFRSAAKLKRLPSSRFSSAFQSGPRLIFAFSNAPES